MSLAHLAAISRHQAMNGNCLHHLSTTYIFKKDNLQVLAQQNHKCNQLKTAFLNGRRHLMCLQSPLSLPFSLSVSQSFSLCCLTNNTAEDI